MSIFGILSSSLSHYQLGAARTPYQQTFQQLGQDLQSGNLSAAQSDLATLQKAISQTATTSDPVTQAFHQLATDLQSGNLSAAQKDFSTLQQDLQASHFHHRLSVSLLA
jgi:outer membrane protein assembly factor BamD (BamD/ComL family)